MHFKCDKYGIVFTNVEFNSLVQNSFINLKLKTIYWCIQKLNKHFLLLLYYVSVPFT